MQIANSVLTHWREGVMRQEEDEQVERFCSPECFWSAQLAGAGSVDEQQESRKSTPSLGVNPLARKLQDGHQPAGAAATVKKQTWSPEDGDVRVRTLDVRKAENAMFQFHGQLSSTFRPELTFLVR